MKKLAILGLLISSMAFAAATKTEVYKIVSLTEASPNNWVALETVTGSVVYVRCNTRQFDDPARDRVGGFESEDKCQDFLALIRKHANRSNPVEIWIGENLVMEIKVSL